MSLQKSSDSKAQCPVVSKFFSSNNGMDDSLSDFQEKKSAFAESKSAKNSGKVEKIKRSVKKIKGQRDIRSVLKTKNNDLVNYSKDFTKICKNSGIDVDPEQLQLAIALSKSLQTDPNEGECAQITVSRSQGRSERIKSTLQEYGFKVPEIKKSTKRNKKIRKPYKLLLTNIALQKEITASRYSKILFENLNTSYKNTDSTDTSLILLYHTTTNILYEQMKDNNLFYVSGIVEKIDCQLGSMLKDWSEIPGRPKSPQPKLKKRINISEIEHSQEQLDIILSGSLETVQKIMKNHVCVYQSTNATESKSSNDGTLDISENAIKMSSSSESNEAKSIKTTEVVRSVSPDLFDDESLILEKSEHNIRSEEIYVSQNSQTHYMDVTEEKSLQNVRTQEFHISQKSQTHYMDLTECVAADPINSEIEKSLSCSKLSQKNVTKRQSNDLMEITDCVATSTKDVYEYKHENSAVKMGLTRTCVDKNILESHENIDLTQSSNSSDDTLPYVQISGRNKSMNETVSLNNEDFNIDKNESCFAVNYLVNDNKVVKSKANDALTNDCLADDSVNQSHSSPDPRISYQSIVDDYFYTHSDEDRTATNTFPNIEVNNIIKDNENEEIDLIQPSNSYEKKLQNRDSGIIISSSSCYTSKNCKEIDLTQSFNSNDFIQQNKDSNIQNGIIENKIIEAECSNTSCDLNKEIDLTQSSDSDKSGTQNHTNIQKVSFESLGKKDDLSIDYDEVICSYDKTVQINANESTGFHNSYENKSATDNKISKTTNSNISVAFEISDGEFNYSMNKSKVEMKTNFDIGDLSVINNLSNINSFNQSYGSKTANVSINESYLPEINVKTNSKIADTCFSIEKSVGSENIGTPYKEIGTKNSDDVQTPNNSDYIIKTNDVTPLRDYSSMSTPERNSELEKYGLKPFKRKRAIQLLTHLYNQTHPIVETLPEQIGSPLKRVKKSPNLLISPKKVTKSPTKSTKSPKKQQKCVSNNKVTQKVYEEGNIYRITDELPELNEIKCCPEDWVFQKREKAKVHSCRVPLHIAFFNYVACRRALREAILRYEPINIDVIHKDLVAIGHRYDPKDLLKFMDKKCITVKTADNNSRNTNR